MQIRKIQWEKGSAMVTLPRDLVRLWHLEEVHYVVMTLEEGALRIRPLSNAELIHYPAPEE